MLYNHHLLLLQRRRYKSNKRDETSTLSTRSVRMVMPSDNETVPITTGSAPEEHDVTEELPVTPATEVNRNQEQLPIEKRSDDQQLDEDLLAKESNIAGNASELHATTGDKNSIDA